MLEIDCKESSTLHWARYDADTRTLEVDFRGKDGAKVSTYRYDGVPVKLFAQLATATSRGAYFAAHIRGRFPTTKLWPAKADVK